MTAGKLLITGWLFIIAIGIGYVFWHQEIKYVLPTPVPDNYQPAPMLSTLQLPATIKAQAPGKPVLLHFFNPDCPCSRFNIKHFNFLAGQNKEQITFKLIIPEGAYPAAAKELLDSGISIISDKDEAIANLCGVYSTPQAVLINQEGKLYYIGLNQGALFLVEDSEDDQPVLKLKSCYAYNRKKFLEKEIAVGEGLVGQAYLERDYIYLTDVPQSYTTITSGLGDATPGSILIMPLLYNEEIIGILELASFKKIPESNIQFLQKAAESIASTMLSTKNNFRTSELLSQAQEQAEMLRAHEEEMHQNMEEMEATQEEIQRRAAEYDKTIAEKEAELSSLREQLQLS